jgi:hypothetical protein
VLLKDLESAVEGDGGAGSWGGLVEGDVGNGAKAGEDVDAHFFMHFLDIGTGVIALILGF